MLGLCLSPLSRWTAVRVSPTSTPPHIEHVVECSAFCVADTCVSDDALLASEMLIF
ncbi:hypothetical protein KCP76_11600 [Salmonella enterica subsp. enterica serovar Weltevreden]|nr:hypothetical protein KCP76_11600 [Salmonella enterica subsp. enterica serovar Weltevreden]